MGFHGRRRDKSNLPKKVKFALTDDGKERIKRATGKVTLQYDLEGNFIKEFVSATEAAKAVGVTPESIYKACRRQFRTVKEFKWKYK